IEQPGIVELAYQVAAPHDPDLAITGGLAHVAVHRRHVTTHEPDIGTRYRRVRMMAEDPGRLVIRPGSRVVGVRTDEVAQHPFIDGGTHRHRANVLDEVRIVLVAGLGNLEE